MKKSNQKNCIAFTLMEMTLVLLITSIIAAASTPIVTSAVSDYAERAYAPTVGEAADAPWRNASGYQGGGTYNSPIKTYSSIGINSKFGSAPSNYKYPALAIEAREGNLITHPQIQIRGTSTNLYSNISMDEYENIAFTTGNSFADGKAASTNYIGARNIFMGSDIQAYSGYTYNYMYYNDSIFMGYVINTRMTENAINIGNNISRHTHERNTVNIGSNLGSSYSSNTYQGNVIIGNYSNLTKIRDVITIGNYASQDSAYNDDVVIGNFAGRYSTVRNSGLEYTTDSIAIGGHAAERLYKFTGAVDARDARTITIGYNAGSVNSTKTTYAANRNNSIMIGYYSGNAYLNARLGSSNNIAIGKYADLLPTNYWTSLSSSNNIKIGMSVGRMSIPYSNNILIGSYAGESIKGDNIIAIGSSQSYVTSTGYNAGQSGSQGIILIGAYAGAYNRAKYGTVAIGSYANYNSSTNVNYLYGNVGIGPYACANLTTARNKWCLGWGGYSSAISSFWTPTTDTPEMFIGYANSTAATTSIILYASKVYRPNSTVFNTFSDRRLKANIVPLPENSLEKIRKVNIYDYTLKDDDHKAPQIGVLAQEHKNVFPQDVRIEPTSKLYAVGLDWMIYTMLDAIKDIDKNVQNLQIKMNAYIKDFMGLKSKVAKLEAQSKALNNQNKALKSRLIKINAKLK